MTNVIPFKRREPEVQHASGEAVCLQCEHTWTAVAPTGTEQLECPNCHTLKGHWKFEFAPAEGDLWRECGCGNHLFYLTPQGHVCARCGIYQEYD